ncbi:MAG: Lrp/AsnC family transcriptional regulator [Erysipelotrichaceae bacterium]
MDEIRLLKTLEKQSNMNVQDLSDILNESVEEVTSTIKELEAKQVICGYHTVINWDKTSTEKVQAMIEVSAKPTRDKGYDYVASKIYRYPEVSTMYLMSGKSEFSLIIDGKTMREVADFVAQKLAPIDGVRETVTSFVLKPYKVEGVILEEDYKDDQRLLVTP